MPPQPPTMEELLARYSIPNDRLNKKVSDQHVHCIAKFINHVLFWDRSWVLLHSRCMILKKRKEAPKIVNGLPHYKNGEKNIALKLRMKC